MMEEGCSRDRKFCLAVMTLPKCGLMPYIFGYGYVVVANAPARGEKGPHSYYRSVGGSKERIEEAILSNGSNLPSERCSCEPRAFQSD